MMSRRLVHRYIEGTLQVPSGHQAQQLPGNQILVTLLPKISLLCPVSTPSWSPVELLAATETFAGSVFHVL
jgi:hypothetical protein